jgi:hypothetical protein
MSGAAEGRQNNERDDPGVTALSDFESIHRVPQKRNRSLNAKIAGMFHFSERFKRDDEYSNTLTDVVNFLTIFTNTNGSIGRIKGFCVTAGGNAMNFKIVTAQSEVETDDTGTYPDGLVEHNRVELSLSRERQHRRSHERDYGAGKRIAPLPVGLV